MSVYELTEKSLGKGSFGEVILAMNFSKNEYEAAKKLPRKIGKVELENLTNEILISTSFVNPNIIKICEIFEAGKDKYLMFEYCDGGDLKKCMNKFRAKYNKNFPEPIIQNILGQILNGLSCLHRNKIIHHDLKPENILLKFKTNEDKENFNFQNCCVKISDFGLSKFKNVDEAEKLIGGSPLYMPPELFDRNVPNEVIENEAVDIWSLGAIAYELFYGENPFKTREVREIADLVRVIQRGKYYMTLGRPISVQLMSFINSCLQNKQEIRMRANELMFHEFITGDFKNFQFVYDNKSWPDELKTQNAIIMDTYDNLKMSEYLGM